MSRRERWVEKATEISKKVDVGVSVVAVGGAFLGLIPVGVAAGVVAFSVATYYGADYVGKRFGKGKEFRSKKQTKVVYRGTPAFV